MKVTIGYRGLRATQALNLLIKDRLFGLEALSRLDGAGVLIEHRPDQSPAYRAEVRVAVPGPDVSVEAVDHTVANAFRRAMAEVESRLRDRARRRARQTISHRSHPANFRIGRRSR